MTHHSDICRRPPPPEPARVSIYHPDGRDDIKDWINACLQAIPPPDSFAPDGVWITVLPAVNP